MQYLKAQNEQEKNVRSTLEQQIPGLKFIYFCRIPFLLLTNFRVPSSCCISNGASGITTNCSPSNQVDIKLIYQEDCFDNAAEFFSSHVKVIGAISVVYQGNRAGQAVDLIDRILDIGSC